MNYIKFIFPLFFIYNFTFTQHYLSPKDLTVFKEPAATMMQDYLTNIVERQFAKRDSLLSTLRSVEEWNKRIQTISDSIIDWTGPFPDRTPLKPRITGRIEREDFFVEKILFESRPDYLVSANLYLPKNIKTPLPAQLNVIGHAQLGKADERYQRMSIAQVKNGFVVLTIDQIGQGERGLLSSHQKVGTQAFIAGTHIFNFMVWDAIRAIDYLISRPEVDPEKICITGSSGGGMMSTYILPFENRIAVSVPTCNPNTWNYRVQNNLATDHEQVFFGAFQSCIDPRGDPLFAHVPKPLLLNTTTDDNLNPPRGVWELSTWLYKAYSVYGMPEKFNTTMVKAGHAYNQEQREITYAWMRRWMDVDVPNFWEENAIIENEEDLWAAKNGNVFNEPGSRYHQELVLDYLKDNKAKWKEIKTVSALKNHKINMYNLIEEVLHTDLNITKLNFSMQKPGQSGEILLQPFMLEPENGITIPGIIFKPSNIALNNNIILYLNENGKTEILANIDILNELLNKGYQVCVADLRGIGESSPDMAGKFWDFLAGKPIFGQRVFDILSLIKWLKESEIQAQKIILWGSGMCSLYGAFAGVISEDISTFILEEPLISFESVVQTKDPEYNHEIILPGILEKFDMSQVYQALSPRPLSIINPRSGNKSFAIQTETEILYKSVLPAYKIFREQKVLNVLKTTTFNKNQIIFDALTK